MTNRIQSWLFIALVLLLGGWSLLLHPRALPTLQQVGNGQAQTAFAADFDTAFAPRDFSLGLWSFVSLTLFGEGQRGVLVGEDGWLYSSEEWEVERAEPAALDAGINAIQQAAARLEAAGANLCIVVVPDKARMVPDHLRHTRPAAVEARYDRALTGLRAAGLPVEDLRPIIQTLPASQRYMRTDTHWTPATTLAVAASTCAGFADPLAADSFETVAAPAATHRGDLMSFIKLGWFERFSALKPEAFTGLKTEGTNTGGGLGLFGDAPDPIILVGTSYSAMEEWNFRGAICEATNRDVVNWSKPGQGPFVPMDAYLESADFADNPTRDVIWEIPERQLARLEAAL